MAGRCEFSPTSLPLSKEKANLPAEGITISFEKWMGLGVPQSDGGNSPSLLLPFLKRPGERSDFGRAGQEHVRQKILLPRLVRDELRLVLKVIQ